jgi:cytochrome P450
VPGLELKAKPAMSDTLTPSHLDDEASAHLLEAIADPASRPNPYPLYEILRERPVWRNAGGAYVIGRYRDVANLIRDPRLSSDAANFAQGGAALSFLNTDPPEHDRLRRMTMRYFGPPGNALRVQRMTPVLKAILRSLVDKLADRSEVDVVTEISYAFPGRVIADLLGVPREDEPKFCAWAEAIAQATDRDAGYRSKAAERSFHELAGFMLGLVNKRRRSPGEDLLSCLVNSDGPDGAMRPDEIVRVSVLLLLAGHETTVNLISNGVLTLLRFPHQLERLRNEPTSALSLVEELLRYEPPVHIVFRGTLCDVDVGGVRIPGGSSVQLMLGSANRDPRRFDKPGVFDPDRRNNQHLGFGSGIHSCFGAPLARLEGQMALCDLARRLISPRLVQDPPPYRFNPTLRGPRELRVAIDGVVP